VNIANLQRAADLAREAERLERTIAAYREADRINVSLTAAIHSRGADRSPDHVEQHRVEMTAVEIGDAVVDALSRRLAKMRAELAGLGVTVGEAADPRPCRTRPRRACPAADPRDLSNQSVA
jgi:hypothetical protein